MNILNGLRKKLLGPFCRSDDLISDDELYHRYVDMLAAQHSNAIEPQAVQTAAEQAVSDFVEPMPGAKGQLVKILSAMMYAHAATSFTNLSNQIISSLQ